jgi:hypothetical protein
MLIGDPLDSGPQGFQVPLVIWIGVAAVGGKDSK